MSKKKRYEKGVSVSHLSAYASDPVAFCNARGGAYNKEAAQWGNEMHSKTGKSSALFKIVALIVLLAGGYLWLWW